MGSRTRTQILRLTGNHLSQQAIVPAWRFLTHTFGKYQGVLHMVNISLAMDGDFP